MKGDIGGVVAVNKRLEPLLESKLKAKLEKRKHEMIIKTFIFN